MTKEKVIQIMGENYVAVSTNRTADGLEEVVGYESTGVKFYNPRTNANSGVILLIFSTEIIAPFSKFHLVSQETLFLRLMFRLRS